MAGRNDSSHVLPSTAYHYDSYLRLDLPANKGGFFMDLLPSQKYPETSLPLAVTITLEKHRLANALSTPISGRQNECRSVFLTQ